MRLKFFFTFAFEFYFWEFGMESMLTNHQFIRPSS